MRDRFWISPQGARVPVSMLPTRQIQQMLSGPVRAEGPDGTDADIRSRLEIELLIRALDL